VPSSITATGTVLTSMLRATTYQASRSVGLPHSTDVEGVDGRLVDVMWQPLLDE
jgi:hypothetical protein